MAIRYWVGGTGEWSSTNTTNWAATSGGAGGASVPTSADLPQFDANSGSGIVTFTNGGVAIGSPTLNNPNIELSLGAAISTTGATTVTSGTFTTNGYNVTSGSFTSNGALTRAINFGSSTVTLANVTTAFSFQVSTNLTFDAGTSTIVMTGLGNPLTFSGGGNTFYNLSFTGANFGFARVEGANTFNNLLLAGRTSAGIKGFSFNADQIINGTLTLSAGTNASMRTFVQSDIIAATRTLTCNAFVATDTDFRDIVIAGAAAPASGTRLGDCKGNSGITFDAAKTVFWRSATGASWGAASWSLALGGTADITAMPLAQDTAIFSTYPTTAGSSVSVNAAYNIGTIDMSARTSVAMTLATSATSPTIYGDWINGAAVTITGTGSLIFAGCGSQSITSAGKTFTQRITINTPGGSVTLQDAFTDAIAATFIHLAGTLDLNDYSMTWSGGAYSATAGLLDVGTATLTIGKGCTFSTSMTVAGTGTINMASGSSKTFTGAGLQTYPTLNQGGIGTLTITGSNKFADITNSAIGRVQFTGGTTNEFSAFNLNGISGTLLAVGSTNTTQAILKKPDNWNVGADSVDAGNNTGLTFA